MATILGGFQRLRAAVRSLGRRAKQPATGSVAASRAAEPGDDPWIPPAASATRADFDAYLDRLREKWKTIPAESQGRIDTSRLAALPEAELMAFWRKTFEDTSAGAGWKVRGWYHELYAPLMRSSVAVLDVGSGLGHSSIFFARQGARVTCLDIVESNLAVVRRVRDHYRLGNVRTVLLRDLAAVEQLGESYDVITAIGSLLHAPFELNCLERRALTAHLKPGGRWLELTYPKTRWVRDGRLPFDQWGVRTDGIGTPWAEWYELPKLLHSLQPACFDVLFTCTQWDEQINWFDLVKR